MHMMEAGWREGKKCYKKWHCWCFASAILTLVPVRQDWEPVLLAAGAFHALSSSPASPLITHTYIHMYPSDVIFCSETWRFLWKLTIALLLFCLVSPLYIYICLTYFSPVSGEGYIAYISIIHSWSEQRNTLDSLFFLKCMSMSWNERGRRGCFFSLSPGSGWKCHSLP